MLQYASLWGFNATLYSYASKSTHPFNFDLHYFKENDGWDGHRDRYQEHIHKLERLKEGKGLNCYGQFTEVTEALSLFVHEHSGFSCDVI